MAGYRDEREALRARNDALAADLAEARGQLAEAERKLALRDSAAELTAPAVGGELVTELRPGGPAASSSAQAASDALALVEEPPSPRLTAVAYASAIALLAATPLVALWMRDIWPALAALGVVALGSSLAHLRAQPGRQNGLFYYGLMALCGLVPFGGVFAPLPCAMVFGEYQRRTAVPYALTTLALVLTPIWFFLRARFFAG